MNDPSTHSAKPQGGEPAESTSSGQAPEMIEKEKYLRLAAEFENYRKHEGRRREDDQWAAKRDSLIMMLDVIDGGEVGFKNSPKEVREKFRSWYSGMLQAHELGVKELLKIGVRRVETEGKVFDPVTMEAIQTVPGGKSHLVQKEMQAGYALNGKLIRPARVIIYE